MLGLIFILILQSLRAHKEIQKCHYLRNKTLFFAQMKNLCIKSLAYLSRKFHFCFLPAVAFHPF